MNKKMILYTISRIMILEALLMILPILVGFWYKEDMVTIGAFLKTILVIIVIFLYPAIRRPVNEKIYIREGMIIAGLSWFIMSFFGGLPFFFSGEIKSLIDCFFETASGFTTTGSTIINDLSLISNSILFWRSFTHFVGGMGVLVLALAVFPEISTSSVQIMKAEVPGPQFGKIMSKLSNTARILYLMYVVMTIVLIFILILVGMPIFDSILHAFGTAGTGGFGIKNGSILPYNSPVIEMVLAVGMLIFGVNFNLYYLILIGKAKDAFKSEELKIYLGIVLGACVLILFDVQSRYATLHHGLRDVFFTVSSIITTTGFSTADFGDWPVMSKWVLLMLMFIGACAGSTAGGLKVSRIIIIVKSAFNEVRKSISPHRALSVKFEGKRLDSTTERGVVGYFLVYCVLFAFFTLIVSIDAPDFKSSFSAVAATYNNIGPGLGVVGPANSFAEMSDLSKVALSIAMITGRLELFPVIAIFAPQTWRDN